MALRNFILSALFFLCFVVPFLGASAQTIQVKDSLKQALKNATNDNDRIRFLNALSYEYYDFDDSVGFLYARKALALALQVNDQRSLKRAYTLVGIGHFSFGDYTGALLNFRLSNAISYSIKTIDDHLYNLVLTGDVLTDLGKFDSAALQYDKGIVLANQFSNVERLSRFYRSYARLKTQLWENQEALEYLRKSEALQATNNVYSQIDLYHLYARAYINLANHEKAEEYTIKLCTAVGGIDDNFHKSMCDLLWAELHSTRGNYPQALVRVFQALETAKIFSYHLLRAQTYIATGDIYTELSQYDLAMGFYLRALAITEKSGLEMLTAQVYAEIAWINKDQKNYSTALEYLEKSQRIRQQIGDRKGVANCHNTRGLVFLLQKKYSQSIQEHEHALQLREAIAYNEGIAASLYNLSLAYEELGNFTKALELQLKSLAIDEHIGNAQSLSISYNGLAELLLRLGRSSEAEVYIHKSYHLAKKTKSKILLLNCYDSFIAFYKTKKEFSKALEFAEKYRVISDSVFSEGNSMRLAEMQALYQVERKEAEIKLLNRDKELSSNKLSLQNMQIKNQRIIIAIVSVLLALVVLFSIILLRFNRKVLEAKLALAEVNEEITVQSEELRESNQSLVRLNDKSIEDQEEIQAQSEELTESNNTLIRLNEDLQEQREEIEAQSEELREASEIILSINKSLEDKVKERTQQLRQAYIELDTFFYRSSHDFRRPITTFMGLAEVAKITVKDEKALDLFEKVSDTAHSLDKMLRKLQSISDVGAQDLVYKEVLLRELIENVLMSFQDELRMKNIRITEELKLPKPFYSYAALVKVVIENILENAIQFSGIENQVIKISARQTDEHIILVIEDNGQGIAQEYHERVFDMYFRANITSKGNGLGLYIVQKAVFKLNGSISFQSVQYEGTVFTVELPLNT